jgi:hypothetical protein
MNYLGFKYSNTRATQFIKDNGPPQTLKGTDNFLWVSYFEDTDITICMVKRTSIIKNVVKGRVENLKPIEDD